ncbi:MAG: putative spermidine/putrescine transport system substrate-binding protein [Ilumatobacteraceae bacterium]
MTPRTTPKTVAALAALSFVLISCGSDKKAATDTAAPAVTSAAGGTTAGTTAASATTAAPAATTGASATTAAAGGGSDLSTLAAACKTEGKVNLIALPDEWANYKGILQSFRDKYPGVQNPVANPNFSSQEELDSVVNLKGQADMPDTVDVSPAKAKIATDEGLWDPYQPTTWAQIPDNLKDPAGNWVAAYYGIISIGTNTTIVKNAPKSWADLKKPDYKGQVALNGDPRTSGSAYAAVMAASLANGGSADDIMPGIQFFADLKKAGNLIPTEVTQATVISGETPIALDWSYNYPGLAKQIQDAGFTVEVNFPADGVYGGYYAQGVIKGSPHPNCSKLWVEHILSDEGALGYLQGGAMPARFAELEKAGKITADAKKNLPPADLLAKVAFQTAAQVDKANQALQDQWGPMVADA